MRAPLSRRAMAFGLVVFVAVLASGCAGGKTAAPNSTVRTVTVPAKPVALKRTAPKPLSFPQLVSRVQSGVLRLEARECDGLAVGTGFLIAPNLIATVEHVVDGASSITVKRHGVVLGSARVVGVDPSRDLALLRTPGPISGHVFQLATRSPALGEAVAAFGFPLGLPLTVTRGSVSGLDRAIPIGGVTRHRLVQTDAAVNPGNSGGPLLATDTGDVVGLVDLGTTAANGLAFAVSAQVAQPLLHAWQVAPQPAPATSCAPLTAPAVPASPPSAGTSGENAAAAETIYGYWDAIQSGDYATAYSYLTPSEGSAVGGRRPSSHSTLPTRCKASMSSLPSTRSPQQARRRTSFGFARLHRAPAVETGAGHTSSQSKAASG